MAYEPPVGLLVGPDAVQGARKGDEVELFLPERLEEMEQLGKGRVKPGVVPVCIVRTTSPEEHVAFKAMKTWIDAEIGRRVAGGEPAEQYATIHRALIVFPPKSAPERHRVLLNDEVKVLLTVRPAYTASFANIQEGQEVPLSLRDMFDLRGFTLQGVDMEHDGYAYLRQEPGGWALYFNVLPTSGITDRLAVEIGKQIMRGIQDAIAYETLRTFAHGVFPDDPGLSERMTAAGWCPTPILLPEPWRQMCDVFRRGAPDEADALAIAAVGPEQLDLMLKSWLTVEPFASDRSFLTLGIKHYKAGDYISAISVLLPRIEGLANRCRTLRGIGARDNLKQVFASLERLASDDVRNGFIASRIRDEFAALIDNFLLIRFYPTDPGAEAARGRHAHAHGATGEAHYDQRYALQIILALDALYCVAR